jgi:arylsulfatase A-like enzyme
MKVLVIVARGLQAGALGCYSNLWVQTPHLDGLAAGGVVFDRHLADAADAEGARRAWRSGRYHLPQPVGQAFEPDARPVRLECLTCSADLLRALRTKGIHTHLILDASRPAPADFVADWQVVEEVAAEGEEPGLERAVEAAGAALADLAGREDWLLWVDLGTALPPWNVPEEFQEPYQLEAVSAEEEEGEGLPEEESEEAELLPPLSEVEEGPIDPEDDDFFLRLHNGYAAAVSYLDAGVGEVLGSLAETAGDDVIVLFTSDRGLALGEHGMVGSVRSWLHEEVVHVPLVVRLPSGAEAGVRVAVLTQNVDLACTLAGLFGVSLEGAHGHDLIPLARGAGGEVRPYACSGLRVGEAEEWALRTPEWVLLLPGRGAAGDPQRMPQLYVKPDDRGEVNNVVQHHLDFAEGLERTLRGFLAVAAGPGPLVVPPLPEREANASTTSTEPTPVRPQ